MKRITSALLGLALLSALPLNGQNTPAPGTKRPLIVSVFNQATLLPGSGEAFANPHPGLSLGTEFRYNRSTVNQWFQTAKLALAYHQYVQTSVQLYSEAGYRRAIWRGIGAEMRLGAGYLHSFPDVVRFRFKDGAYQPIRNVGRAQAMLSTAAGLSYTFPRQPFRLFIDYQFYLQLPFVKQYVPLVPNTAWHAGLAWPLFRAPAKS